ncbi:MAG TPA: hypothetical protein VJQ43_00295, partial [Thermoplasmata archaeon]|nr:hypothetical protein [Thermoplasmata archaeon]
MSGVTRAATIFALVLVGLLPTLLASPVETASSGPIVITPVYPTPGLHEPSHTPTIQASFSDSAGTIVPTTIFLTVGTYNLTDSQGWKASATGLSCPVPTILPLRNDIWNVTVTVSDSVGNTANLTWNFTVDPNATVAGAPVFSIRAQTILEYVGIGAAVAVGIFAIYILYLR